MPTNFLFVLNTRAVVTHTAPKFGVTMRMAREQGDEGGVHGARHCAPVFLAKSWKPSFQSLSCKCVVADNSGSRSHLLHNISFQGSAKSADSGRCER